MEKIREYSVIVNEEYQTSSNLTLSHFALGDCRIATVNVKAKSAQEAVEKALERVKEKVEAESFSIGRVSCYNELHLPC